MIHKAEATIHTKSIEVRISVTRLGRREELEESEGSDEEEYKEDIGGGVDRNGYKDREGEERLSDL